MSTSQVSASSSGQFVTGVVAVLFVPAALLEREDFGGDLAVDFPPDFAAVVRFEPDDFALVVFVAGTLPVWAAGADSLASGEAGVPPSVGFEGDDSTPAGFESGEGAAGNGVAALVAALPSDATSGPGALMGSARSRVCQYA